jgi:hypothetical protein
MLGLVGPRIVSSNGNKMRKSGRATCSEWHGKLCPSFLRPELGARAGLFIVEDEGSHYNTLNATNYLLRL